MCENLWQHRKGIIKHWLHLLRNGRIYFRSPVVFSINLLSSLKIAIWPLSIILLLNQNGATMKRYMVQIHFSNIIKCERSFQGFDSALITFLTYPKLYFDMHIIFHWIYGRKKNSNKT